MNPTDITQHVTSQWNLKNILLVTLSLDGRKQNFLIIIKMFVLAELKDTIRIPPEMFNLKLVDAVKDEINRKLANKVNSEHCRLFEIH